MCVYVSIPADLLIFLLVFVIIAIIIIICKYLLQKQYKIYSYCSLNCCLTFIHYQQHYNNAYDLLDDDCLLTLIINN